jgi:hypothetical protein
MIANRSVALGAENNRERGANRASKEPAMLNQSSQVWFTLVVGSLAILLTVVPARAQAPVREVLDQGFRVRLDLSRQVIDVSIPDDHGFGDRGNAQAPISPSLQGAEFSGLVSASVLSQKAKLFDDGLYAAVELAAERGAGSFAGKSSMLRSVAGTLAGHLPADSGNIPAIIFGACQLGDIPVPVPDSVRAQVDSGVQGFLAEPLRSKPIGFYTWNRDLAAIFQQERMLQSELKGRAGIESLVQALHADPEARATYAANLTLASRLTNPLVGPSLRELLEALDHGALHAPEKGISFLPPSRAHETDLIKKLYGNRPIPEGFSLVDEMIKRIRARQISLQPTNDSGWYDYQTWSLEPLVVPESTPEAPRLRLNESYRKQLLELFKGILALTRETHIKQLEIPAAGSAAFSNEPKKVIIEIRPDLSAEPLVTYYNRRAQSYHFVRTVLEQAFGEAALANLHRLTAEGAEKASLADELGQLQALFFGASVVVARQLGMSPLKEQAIGSANDSDADAGTFQSWARNTQSDPDLGRDVRMMVPLFYDLGRRKTKVWVFLGWAAKPVTISYAQPPRAEVFQGDRKVEGKSPEIRFVSNHERLAYPVTAEVYVTKILDRDEFRKLCDRFKTQSEIIKNLE